MRHLRAGLGLCALAAVSACDIPTQAPIYDTEWSVPGKSAQISVNTLLPHDVSPMSDNSAFRVTVSPSSSTISRRLGQDCSACAAANGLSVPKPPFVGGGTTSLALPTSISSATLVHDTVTLTIANGYNFDPIRPSASARGYITIVVTNGSTVVGRDSIDGATTSLAAGATLTRKIPLSGAISAASGLAFATTLNSPVGDPVTINMSRTITVSGSIDALFVSQAQVSIANQAVTSSATELDLTGVGDKVTKRANGGSLQLDIDNPFNVTGSLTLGFDGGDGVIAKNVPLTAGASAPAMTFTKAELDRLLGHNVVVSYSGIVNGSSVTVRPGQTVTVASRLQVAINMGGTK